MVKRPMILLFPGQGSQYVGMEKLLPEGSSLLKRANDVLGYDLARIMAHGPEEELTKTEHAQPALFLVSVGIFEEEKERLTREGWEISCVLGHSVGEYAALAVAGSLSFEDGLKATRQRGLFMQETSPVGSGKMVAILTGPEGLPQDLVDRGLSHVREEYGAVGVANENSPRQTVFSGETQAVETFVSWLKENHSSPFKSVDLKVSAPFHSSLMVPAAKKMEEFFQTVTVNPNNLPYVANADAQYYGAGTSSETIVQNLVAQIPAPVKWRQGVSCAMERFPKGVFKEVGPGRVLRGLLRKIGPEREAHE